MKKISICIFSVFIKCSLEKFYFLLTYFFFFFCYLYYKFMLFILKKADEHIPCQLATLFLFKFAVKRTADSLLEKG